MKTLAVIGTVVIFATTSVGVRAADAKKYNELNMSGNVAAQNGQFEVAISDWRRAVPLDPSPNKKCRGQLQRVDIKAAQDTMSMMHQGKLTADAAPAWFRNHSTELWMPNPCNSN